MKQIHQVFAGVYLFIVVGLTNSVIAQTAPQQSGEIEPASAGIGERIVLGEEKRLIEIHRQQANQALGTVIVRYFHRPLFVLQTSPKPIDGFPDIVTAPPERRNGKTYLTFRVILTSKTFQETARAFVYANDPELRVPGSHVDLNNIRVNVWPIVNLTVKVTDPLTGDVLGQWLSPDLRAAPPVIDVPIGFDDQALESFKQRAPNGKLWFEFAYTFKNIRQQYAAAVSEASRKVNQALRSAVTSQNLSPDSPIFQSQADQLKSTLATKLVTEITASSAEMVPLVQAQLLDKYLPMQTTSIDKLADSQLRDAIYAYLKPLLETASEKRSQSNTTTHTHDDTVDVKFGSKLFSLGATDKDTISRTAGVTFDQSKTDQSYKPADINVYKLVEITDNPTVDIVSRAFIAQGGDASFQTDTPIPSNFTDKSLSEFPAAERIPNFDGVLPGMAFCYFGDSIPPGYMELDESKTWPDEAWVPQHLRSKAMPAAQDVLLGVSRKLDDVGTLWTSGAIAIGDVAVPATGLGLILTTAANPMIQTSVTWPNVYHDMHPGDRVTIHASVRDSPGEVSYILQRGAPATGINGAATARIPAVSLRTNMTNPPNIRCRLIIKQ